MLVDIGLLGRVGGAVIGAERAGIGLQRRHQRVGIHRVIIRRAGIVCAGLLLGLGYGVAQGGHAQPFLAGLVGSLLLGDGDVAFHHALAGSVEQGPDAKRFQNVASGLTGALRQVHKANHDHNHCRDGQQDGDDALCFALCHCASSPFSSWSVGLMPDMARPKSASLALGERMSTN